MTFQTALKLLSLDHRVIYNSMVCTSELKTDVCGPVNFLETVLCKFHQHDDNLMGKIMLNTVTSQRIIPRVRSVTGILLISTYQTISCLNNSMKLGQDDSSLSESQIWVYV